VHSAKVGQGRTPAPAEPPRLSFALGTIRRGLLTGCASAATARSSAWKVGDGVGDVRRPRLRRPALCQKTCS